MHGALAVRAWGALGGQEVHVAGSGNQCAHPGTRDQTWWAAGMAGHAAMALKPSTRHADALHRPVRSRF